MKLKLRHWLYANSDSAVGARGFYRNPGWRATGQMAGDDEVLVLRRPEGE